LPRHSPSRRPRLVLTQTHFWASVGSFTSIYACSSRIRAGCSRHPSRYSARLRLQRLRISRPVVHDGLERFHASRHGRAQCMPHVLSHETRPERRVVGVTRLGPDGIFMYFDLALSSHCGFFRASVHLARSLLEHPQLTRWSVDELVVLAGRCTCVLWAATKIELA